MKYLCKATIVRGGVVKTSPHIEAPKLLKYGGKPDTKLLEYFLWSLECYFNDIQVKEDKSKIDKTRLYFSENATL